MKGLESLYNKLNPNLNFPLVQPMLDMACLYLIMKIMKLKCFYLAINIWVHLQCININSKCKLCVWKLIIDDAFKLHKNLFLKVSLIVDHKGETTWIILENC